MYTIETHSTTLFYKFSPQNGEIISKGYSIRKKHTADKKEPSILNFILKFSRLRFDGFFINRRLRARFEFPTGVGKFVSPVRIPQTKHLPGKPRKTKTSRVSRSTPSKAKILFAMNATGWRHRPLKYTSEGEWVKKKEIKVGLLGLYTTCKLVRVSAFVNLTAS